MRVGPSLALRGPASRVSDPVPRYAFLAALVRVLRGREGFDAAFFVTLATAGLVPGVLRLRFRFGAAFAAAGFFDAL